jgi:hemerythrin
MERGLKRWRYADIDSQHRRLFQRANQLQAEMTAGKGNDCLVNTLKSLVAYANRHCCPMKKC